MDWQDKISGCFGSEDKKFALHPSDLERAFELLVDVRKENVTWSKFEKAVRENLSNAIKNKTNEKSLNTDKVKIHIDEQMEQVRKLFAPWLE